MEALHTQRCAPCRADSPALGNEQARRLLGSIPGWRIEIKDGIPRLAKTFCFDDFREAFEFAARICAVAEQENHHPMITIEWGKTGVQWWTHSIAGLHRNDFIMAAKTQMAARQ